MRNGLLIGAVTGIGAIMAVACGSSGTTGDTTLPEVEGGTSGNPSSSGLPGSSGNPGGDSGTSGGPDGGTDGGTDGGGVMPTTLKAGAAILIGITSDGYAAYIAIGASSASLEVVPVTGGAATVLVPAFAQTDGVAVSGASVAYWTTVTAGIGTLGYWSKASGPKAAVAAASKSGMFFSTTDSARIAFSVGATATSTDLALTTPVAAANTPVLTGNAGAGRAINLAAAASVGGAPPNCAPDIRFKGKILFAAYCTGTAAGTTAARLVTIPDASTTAKRLDNASVAAAGSVIPFLSADTTGTKVFVINSGANATGRIIFNGAALTEANLENDTKDGLMLDDGTGVFYRLQNAAGTTKAIKHATTAASPVITPLVATNAEGLLAISNDQTHALYHTLPVASGLVDIRSLATKPPATSVDIVATAIAFPFGFTGNGASVLYQSDVDAQGVGNLKSKPTAGGVEKQLAAAMYDARPLPTGTGVLVLDNPVADATNMITNVDIKYLDSAGAAAPVLLADTVPSDGFDVSGTHLVYARFTGANAGLYAIALP
ncbi:MAG: hypothetical protein JWO86_7770 [Myxococcaceae bacterium]|nr:hypothetical protein [Myxococcaceae bacterium]